MTSTELWNAGEGTGALVGPGGPKFNLLPNHEVHEEYKGANKGAHKDCQRFQTSGNSTNLHSIHCFTYEPTRRAAGPP